MVHAKAATIDGHWSTSGTANLDRLSTIGTCEVYLKVFDELLAQQMEQVF